MRCLLLILLFSEIGISAVTWVRSDMTCFNADTQSVNMQRAGEICRERGSTLHSIKNFLEFAELDKILVLGKYYWVNLTKPSRAFQWGDGRSCCVRDWFGASPSAPHGCARVYRPIDTARLYSCDCSLLSGLLCSKPAVHGWARIDKNDYNLHDLCGVEILQNCKSPNCQALCESHHDCNQVAELSNICINIKNTSESDDCIVKLTPNLELYRKGWNC